jgi:hypothetical protein
MYSPTHRLTDSPLQAKIAARLRTQNTTNSCSATPDLLFLSETAELKSTHEPAPVCFRRRFRAVAYLQLR